MTASTPHEADAPPVTDEQVLAWQIVPKARQFIAEAQELLDLLDAYSLRHSIALSKALLGVTDVFDKLIPDLAETTRRPERSDHSRQ